MLAQEEARLLGHNHIGSEHILLGLIHESGGIGAQALESLSVSLEAARKQVTAIVGPGGSSPVGHLPFTPRAKQILWLSLEEADQLGHRNIGTEHILLALLREHEGEGAQALVRLGLDLGRARQQVFQILAALSAATDHPLPEVPPQLAPAAPNHAETEGDQLGVFAEPPFDVLPPETARLFVRARAEARRRNAFLINTGHVLLAALQGEGPVLTVLRGHALDAASIDRFLLKDLDLPSMAMAGLLSEIANATAAADDAARRGDAALAERYQEATRLLDLRRARLEASEPFTSLRQDPFHHAVLPLAADALAALRNASRFGASITPERLLLSISRMPDSTGGLALADHGITTASLRQHLVKAGLFSPSRVFLSYRREDTRADTGRLADSLMAELGRERVFLDVRLTPLGEDFEATTRDALEETAVLLVMIGPTWLSHLTERDRDGPDYVQIEIDTALKQGIPVIPVLVSGASMPGRAQLPSSLRSLATAQAHALDHDTWRQDLQPLMEALRQRL